MSESIYDAPLDVAMDIAHNVAPPKQIIELPISSASGYVLATDILAKTAIPPFAASRVDGYAINGNGPWNLIGKNLAGQVTGIELGLGQCCYVATGAPIPQNTFAMLKQEDCDVNDSLVSLKPKMSEAKSGENIRPAGFESAENEVVIKASTKLTPALLGLVSACGYDSVMVYEKPTVDVFIFGDELIFQGAPTGGQVRDSIGPQIKAWLEYLGAQLNEMKFIPDELSAHVEAIKNSTADLVLTTGGTASGPADHLHKAITQSGGEILIDAVNVRPGYHQLLAQLPNRFLIGLPGNPQSAVIGLLTLVWPFITGSTNQTKRVWETRRLATSVTASSNEHKFVLARQLTGPQNIGLVEPVAHTDSSMLRGFVDADGYAVITPGGQDINSPVWWISLPK